MHTCMAKLGNYKMGLLQEMLFSHRIGRQLERCMVDFKRSRGALWCSG